MILRTVSIYVFSLPSCCSSSLRALAVAVVAVTAVTERERERESLYEKADSICLRANRSVQECYQHCHADGFPDSDELECRV